jgi:hypothetical protein
LRTFIKITFFLKEWKVKMVSEQAKVPDYEQPKLLTADISDKVDALKREINYMITKAKYFKPKPKKPTSADGNKGNQTKTEDKRENEEDKNEKFEEDFEKMFGEDSETIPTTKQPKRKQRKSNDENDGEKLELDDASGRFFFFFFFLMKNLFFFYFRIEY